MEQLTPDISKNNTCFFILIDSYFIKEQRFQEALQSACHRLSAINIKNFIFYEPTLVKLLDTQSFYNPIIDTSLNRIILQFSHKEEES
jgi:hypothetical protein